MPDYDVIIIGGGPTGLSSAITSTKKGNLNTLVLEEHDTIGHPLACGEGISTEKLFTIEISEILFWKKKHRYFSISNGYNKSPFV
jgi:flavin-dependent dehydrogenase